MLRGKRKTADFKTEVAVVSFFPGDGLVKVQWLFVNSGSSVSKNPIGEFPIIY
jgi:hypothetical protein